MYIKTSKPAVMQSLCIKYVKSDKFNEPNWTVDILLHWYSVDADWLVYRLIIHHLSGSYDNIPRWYFCVSLIVCYSV